jgi:chorismate synthase
MLRRLQLTTAGESHGPGLTAVLSGVPAGLRLDPGVMASDLARRQHGYGRGRRMQIEKDEARVVGGVRDGETLGSPIALWIENRDWQSWTTVMDPWEVDPHMAGKRRVHSPRPGHADLSGGLKYGRKDLRDILERASARETTARVACGAIARMLLSELGVEIRSGVRSLGPIGFKPASAMAPAAQQRNRIGPLNRRRRQNFGVGDIGGLTRILQNSEPVSPEPTSKIEHSTT